MTEIERALQVLQRFANKEASKQGTKTKRQSKKQKLNDCQIEIDGIII